MKKSNLKEVAEITKGRFERRRVVSDFLELVAIRISNRVDPIHRDKRHSNAMRILKAYSESEQADMATYFNFLVEQINKSNLAGDFEDFLTPLFNELGMTHNGQDLTPTDMATLLAKIAFRGLSDSGFRTLDEPTCGCGALILAAAKEFSSMGYSPYQQLVVRATDLDANMVHATYVQLSLYGIPAVVFRGNTLTLEEFSRWYTPMYIVDKWVFKKPLSLVGGNDRRNELLKRVSDPWYNAIRRVEELCKE